MPADGSPRVLITRLSHIGDCILTLPLATAVRQQFPNAKIVWACEKPSDQLLSLCPDIDEIILVPKSWMKRPANWRDLRKQFLDYQFDFAIDPQGITKSAMLAWISGAKKRIGIQGRWGRELSTWLNNQLVETQNDHIVERTLELVQPMLATNTTDWHLASSNETNPNPVFNLSVDTDSLERMNNFLQDAGIKGPFGILNPGASWESKRWPAESISELANRLSHENGISCILTWAGDEEKQLALAIERDTDTNCFIAPPTTLRELAALCHIQSGPRFFVGGDTGPLHIASAMGTPCVGLHGTTRPQDSHAYGPHHIALQAWYQGGTTRQRRVADNDAMRDILVSDVLAACQKLVERLRRSAAA